MRSRLLWRGSATAVGLYVSVALGILGTIVAARALGLDDFGLYATAVAAAALFQVLLDLTVEEALTKYGFRYVAAEEWGKLRRLFGRALRLKVIGGVVAALVLALLAPFADEIFGAEGLTGPMLAAALLPLVYAAENVGGTALLLHGRYDLRGWYLAFSMGLRLAGIAIGVQVGVTATILGLVVAQAIATATVGVAGLAAIRRFPAAPAVPIGEDAAEIKSFVLHSSLATGVLSLRQTAAPILLGVVAGPTQVGLFRVAQSPQSGFAAASSPARLVLLTEQTKQWEEGREQDVIAGIRTYSRAAAGIAAISVPVFLVLMPWLVRVVFGEEYEGAVTAARVILGSAAVQLVLGWTKSLPVTIGRPRLRLVTHGIETIVLLPLVVVLGAEWGVTGAAVAILLATLVFALEWVVVLARLRREVAERSAGAQPESALT
jgi:O-antigen/teichoic acid export membrane protein